MYPKTQKDYFSQSGFEPLTCRYQLKQLQSTALPTELLRAQTRELYLNELRDDIVGLRHYLTWYTIMTVIHI